MINGPLYIIGIAIGSAVVAVGAVLLVEAIRKRNRHRNGRDRKSNESDLPVVVELGRVSSNIVLKK